MPLCEHTRVYLSVLQGHVNCWQFFFSFSATHTVLLGTISCPWSHMPGFWATVLGPRADFRCSLDPSISELEGASLPSSSPSSVNRKAAVVVVVKFLEYDGRVVPPAFASLCCLVHWAMTLTSFCLSFLSCELRIKVRIVLRFQ